jgi:hypothetical protein
MRRLAAFARHHRPRGEDREGDGWNTIKNGELLTLASREFDVFITVDRNLSFQQSLSSFSIAVIVLRAESNRLADLQPLVPKLLAAIPVAKSGIATFVSS